MTCIALAAVLAAVLQEPGGIQEEPPWRRLAEPEGRPSASVLTLSAAAELRLFSGRTRVREFDSVPTPLDLAGDLGLESGSGVRLTAALDTASVRWAAELELFRLEGSGVLAGDFFYDEEHFVGGLSFTTEGDFLFARGLAEFKGALYESGDVRVGFVVGIEYPRIDIRIDQPGAPRGGSSEQYNQFLPYPVAGIAAEWRLSESFTLSGRLLVGGTPPVPTPFQEGGTLTMQVLAFDLQLTASWRVTRGVTLTAGLEFQSWSGSLTSKEDGNELSFASPTATVGIEIRW